MSRRQKSCLAKKIASLFTLCGFIERRALFIRGRRLWKLSLMLLGKAGAIVYSSTHSIEVESNMKQETKIA